MFARTAFALFASSSKIVGRSANRRCLFALALCGAGSAPRNLFIRAPVPATTALCSVLITERNGRYPFVPGSYSLCVVLSLFNSRGPILSAFNPLYPKLNLSVA
jgi:hypothetical protein